MPTLNVAVIGIGNMGQHHARIYAALSQVSLVAVCDTNEVRGRAVAAKYRCHFYTNYQKMLTEEKIEAVSVAVPTALHYKMARPLLEKGIHVLLEKPIATNLKDAADLIRQAKKRNVIFMVGYIERFNPIVQKLRELIHNKELGTIVSLGSKRVGGLPPQARSANVVVDLGTHDIDISSYLLQEFPLLVHGYTSRNIIKDHEDSAVILLRYKRATAIIEINWMTPIKIRTLDITGTAAFARADYINQTITLYKNSPSYKISWGHKDFEEFIEKFSPAKVIRVKIKKVEPLKQELLNFVESIRGNDVPLVRGEDGYRALEIALKIQ